jgi:hypothetical protein
MDDREALGRNVSRSRDTHSIEAGRAEISFVLPIPLVSLVDEQPQGFRTEIGLEASTTPRDLAFRARAVAVRPDAVLTPSSAQVAGEAWRDGE